MTEATLHPTTEDHITGLQEVLDATGLFPGEMLPDMLAPALAGESTALWLTCLQAGKAVGLCYTEPEMLTEGTWNMLALGVLPELQGQGVGKALVAETEARLKGAGARLLIVETSSADDFAQARHFYAASGFEEEARLRDFWAAGDDKVIFRKAL